MSERKGCSLRDVLTFFCHLAYLSACLYIEGNQLSDEDLKFIRNAVVFSFTVPMRLGCILAGVTNYYNWGKESSDTLWMYYAMSVCSLLGFVLGQTMVFSQFKFSERIENKWTSVFWFTFFYCYLYVFLNFIYDCIMLIRWRRRLHTAECLLKADERNFYVDYM